MLYDPHKVGKRASGLMQGLRVEIVPGAGHAAVYDRPDEVNAMLIEFFNNRS